MAAQARSAVLRFRTLLLSWTLFVALVLAGSSAPSADLPTPTGSPVPAYAPLDKVILDFMDRCDCRSATAAVSHDSKLVFSRGYGWSDALEKKRTPPDALMRIGGVTQPITAAAVRKLIRDGKFSLDTKAFPYLKLKPLPFASPDLRLNDITIGDLLEHRGGWGDRSLDPFVDLRSVEKALKVSRGPRPIEIVRFMMGQPLQFDPGTEKAFSNVGYCMLGRVIEKATGKSYATYIKDDLFRPLGIADIRVGRHSADQHDPREVSYPVRGVPIEMMDSFGGLVASAPALCKFLDVYWANGQPRQPGDDEQWTYFGNVVGTTAIVRQRPDGYNIAMIFAVRRQEPLTEKDDRALERQIDEAIDKAVEAEAKP
jgi:CubicO group peptidase (beta-lactamase class C family)